MRAGSTSIVSSPRQTHTTLESRSIDASLRFYREVMGLSTAQHYDKVGLCHATNDHFIAVVEIPRPTPQPYWNYYARPVRRDDVDSLYEIMLRVRAEYGILEVQEPKLETAFGIGTYGFGVCDPDGNWWRVEENAGPFGVSRLPDFQATSVVPPGPISYVTLQSADLAATQDFYEGFLGLETTIRSGAIYNAAQDAHGVNLITVPADGELLPQGQLNHHGLTLKADAAASVDRAFAIAKERAEEFGLRKTLPITHQHGSYSFYLQDRDTNWWEIEILDGGLDPWQRVNLPEGDEQLLDKKRGRNTVKHPYDV